MVFIDDKMKNYKLIPLKKYSKIPSIAWGTNDILPFDDTETGYGIDTGRSKLVVIDCDNKNGVDGFVAFNKLADENDDPLNTFTVETPNDGMHYYYLCPPDIRVKSSVSKLAPGIDVRAIGGYIVGPGSVIKDKNGHQKEYIVSDNSDIEELPQWLVDKVKDSDSLIKKNPSKNNVNNDNITANEEIEQRTALNWAIDKMSNAHEGQRNNVLNHTAYFMGMKKINKNDAIVLVDEAVASGLSRKEAELTFDRAYDKGLQEENTPFEAIVKEYNTKTGTSFKEDPMDTEYYSHLSLSYNLWLKYRNSMLFWEVDSSWYSYNAKLGIWEKLYDDALRRIVKDYLENLVIEVRESKVSKIPAAVYRAQEKLWTKNTVESVIVFAKSDFLNQEANLFDSNLHLINCKSGVVNLKTGDIIPFDKKLYMTKHIPYHLDLDASNEYCDKVIDCIHPDERDYLQLFAGQSLTGYQPNLQVTLFLLGRGSNGKSTFIDLMLRTSGSYGKLQPPNILQMNDGKENYALADFDGLRTVVVEELPESKQLNSGALKRLVGTEKINARRIYGSYHEFINQSTMFVSCNRLPMVNETDDGTWRRLLVFTFPYSYKKTEDDLKNKWDRVADPSVLIAARKKTATAEAFFAWRVKGAMKWFQSKYSERNIPNNIQKTIKSWNENNDIFLAWFNDSIQQETSSFILLQDAFDSFNAFCVKRGNSPVSLRYFISSFTNHKTFFDNKVEYKSKSSVLKEYHQSITSQSKKAGKQESFFLNIAFQ